MPSASGISLSALTVTSDQYNNLTNRLTSSNFGYDNAGNQNLISPFTMSYDAENRQTGFTSTSNGTASYTYDGDGKRVTKITGGVTTTYVYDATGSLAAEYSTSPPSMPCETCYLPTDHLGSTRVITDQIGKAVSRHDFLPFGEELLTTNRTDALDYGTPDYVTHRFTSQQRDTEGPGLDFFHARYFHGAQGRFTSADPVAATPLRVLSPQRWAMYSYAVNTPLSYLDPDGQDAIAVKFSDLAHDLGHAGIASVHADGKGTFADFGPQHGGQGHDAGKYNFIDFKTQTQYGPDGKPTKDSLSALANELADDEGQPHNSVSVAYFRTSDAETVALDAYVNAARDQQAKGNTPTYWVGFRDCIWFCMNGLQKAGIGGGSSVLTIPNFQYVNFWLWADQTAAGTNPPRKKEEVKSKVCFPDGKGGQVCQ